MNTRYSRFVAAVVLLGAVSQVTFAEDLKGRFGVTGSVLAGHPLGQSSVKDQADDAGLILGGGFQYGLTSRWNVGASYENFRMGGGLTVEPILLQFIHRCNIAKHWNPTAQFGLGASRGVDVKNFNHIAAKAGIGLDYFAHPSFAFGPQLNYYYVSDKDDSRRHLHALGLGLQFAWYFGGASAAPAAAAAAPVATAKPAAPAVSAPAPVSVAVTPAQASLNAGQQQAFAANVSGNSNTGVRWSLDPALGQISPAGVYTAPAEVSFAEKVRVTATSEADGSASGSATVHLAPAASAPQQVNISLKVLFDTGKDVVKPEYQDDVKRVADFLKQYPSANAQIEGHTDNVGSEAVNAALSQRRADSIRSLLVSQFGIAESRVSAKGFGSSKPVASNATAEGRAKNRRSVAVISAQK